VTGAVFDYGNGFTAPQLYSTANYQAQNLSGIYLDWTNLKGWNFAGQNLSNASLYNAILTDANLSYASLYNASLANANLSDADLRGATGASLTSANTHDAILPNGTINGLWMTAKEMLTVRNSTIPIHVTGTPSIAPSAVLQEIIDGNPWDRRFPSIPAYLCRWRGSWNWGSHRVQTWAAWLATRSSCSTGAASISADSSTSWPTRAFGTPRSSIRRGRSLFFLPHPSLLRSFSLASARSACSATLGVGAGQRRLDRSM